MVDIDIVRDEKPDRRIQAPPQYVLQLRGWVTGKNGAPLLTQRCSSLQELDSEIDRIKATLDEIRKKAHERWGDH